MSTKSESPYEALERVFHEPHRLAIMSALLAHDGLAFAELKDECGLTDGNLSRHLVALKEFGAVKVKKSFVGLRPRTTVYLARQGREDFLEYLGALREVLQKAAKAAGPAGARERKAAAGDLPLTGTARA